MKRPALKLNKTISVTYSTYHIRSKSLFHSINEEKFFFFSFYREILKTSLFICNQSLKNFIPSDPMTILQGMHPKEYSGK